MIKKKYVTLFVGLFIFISSITAQEDYKETSLLEWRNPQDIFNEYTWRIKFKNQLDNCAGDNKKIEALLKSKNSYQETFLIIAASNGYIQLTKDILNISQNYPTIILERNFHPQKTALIIAAEKGYLEIVKMLINFCKKHTANDFLLKYIWMQTTNNHTAISYAACENKLECIKILFNACKNIPYAINKTLVEIFPQAFISAIERDRTDVVLYIFELWKKYEKQVPLKIIWEAIYLAIISGNLIIIDYLLNQCKQSNLIKNIFEEKNKYGETLFIVAASNRQVNIIQYMINFCIENDISVIKLIRQKKRNSTTALHYAADIGNLAATHSIINFLKT